MQLDDLDRRYILPICAALWVSFNLYFFVRIYMMQIFVRKTHGKPLPIVYEGKRCDFPVL